MSGNFLRKALEGQKRAVNGELLDHNDGLSIKYSLAAYYLGTVLFNLVQVFSLLVIFELVSLPFIGIALVVSIFFSVTLTSMVLMVAGKISFKVITFTLFLSFLACLLVWFFLSLLGGLA